MNKNTLKMIALAASMLVASVANAQSAGEWTVKAGFNLLTPKVESGDLDPPALPHTQAGVGSDIQPVLIFTYGITDNISVELPLGTPYTHALYGKGAIDGTGKLGESSVLPATALVQYRFFDPKSKIRPYVGLGATYAYIFKETGSGQLTSVIDTGGSPAEFKLKSKFAPTFQAGLSFAMNQRLFLDLGVTKTFLKTQATFSTGQKQDLKFDPLGVSLTLGYKF